MVSMQAGATLTESAATATDTAPNGTDTAAGAPNGATSATDNRDPISRLVLSDAPVLIFEIDAGGGGEDDGSVRRRDVRLVGCMRYGARGRPGDSRNGHISAVLVLRALTPARMLGCVRALTGGGGQMPPELLREMLPERGNGHAEAGVWQLSRREFDVLRLLADGETTRGIALELSYSERTVKNIVHDLLAKLNCRTRAHAVALAARQGLI
jgi:DNA-binding CsgD family transcriptional regulator